LNERRGLGIRRAFAKSRSLAALGMTTGVTGRDDNGCHPAKMGSSVLDFYHEKEESAG
jgi:hypothetical protein